MQLALNFTLAELVASTKAVSLGIDNTPTEAVIAELVNTAAMLQRIRDTLKAPITVTSAYRCRQLNTAVGGVTSSDHILGCAADFVVPSIGTPYTIAKILAPLVSVLGIQQLILEGVKGKQWVHVSTRAPTKLANRVITITDVGAQLGIQELA